MLTKEDYLEHLGQIEEVEEKMHTIYSDCFERTDDETIKPIFDALRKDEARHANMVRTLMDLVRK